MKQSLSKNLVDIIVIIYTLEHKTQQCQGKRIFLKTEEKRKSPFNVDREEPFQNISHSNENSNSAEHQSYLINRIKST